MTTHESRLEGIGFLLIAACLGVTLFSIFLAQSVFLVLAAGVWLIVAARDGRRPDVPPFFLPLAVYAAVTLLSAAFSLDPLASLKDSKQLLLFLIVPIVTRFARGPRAPVAIDVIIAIGAASALVGVVQYTAFGFDDLGARPPGALSHYMTYSGVLMLVTCAAVARLAYHQKEWIWPAIAVPALLVALAVTQARNAWIGTFGALVVILALRRPRLAMLVPLVAVAGLALAPQGIRDRAFSIVDLNDPTTRDRFAMLKVGAGVIQDYPLFGVGPEMIERVYPDYRPAEAVNDVNPHLHNVPMQVAAERGLIALVVWLWFIAVAGLDLLEQARRGPAKPVAAAGLGALVAMLGAGMFEYNFGDSEFLMLFLGLITLPSAAAAAARATARAEGKGQRAEVGSARSQEPNARRATGAQS
jgi:O-antigen ligase